MCVVLSAVCAVCYVCVRFMLYMYIQLNVTAWLIQLFLFLLFGRPSSPPFFFCLLPQVRSARWVNINRWRGRSHAKQTSAHRVPMVMVELVVVASVETHPRPARTVPKEGMMYIKFYIIIVYYIL